MATKKKVKRTTRKAAKKAPKKPKKVVKKSVRKPGSANAKKNPKNKVIPEPPPDELAGADPGGRITGAGKVTRVAPPETLPANQPNRRKPGTKKKGRPKGSKDRVARKPKSGEGGVPSTDPLVDSPAHDGSGNPPGGVNPQIRDEQKTERAKTAATALVTSVGLVLCKIFPPKLDDEEKEELIEVWTPVMEMYDGDVFTNPWAVAGVTTLGMMAPRVTDRIWGATDETI